MERWFRKINYSPRSKKKSSGDALNSNKLFGAELCAVSMCTDEYYLVPEFVRNVCHYLIKHGLHTEGIFRVNGNAKQIDQFKSQFEKSAASELSEEIDIQDMYALAGVLKLFLREIVDGLVPEKFTAEFAKTTSNYRDHSSLCFSKLKRLLKSLPLENFCLLAYLVKFLIKVADQEHTNKMTANSLGIIFGPCVFRCPMDAVGIKNQGLSNYLMTLFIQHFEEIFPSLEELSTNESGLVINSETNSLLDLSQQQSVAPHSTDNDNKLARQGNNNLLMQISSSCSRLRISPDKRLSVSPTRKTLDVPGAATDAFLSMQRPRTGSLKITSLTDANGCSPLEWSQSQSQSVTNLNNHQACTNNSQRASGQLALDLANIITSITKPFTPPSKDSPRLSLPDHAVDENEQQHHHHQPQARNNNVNELPPRPPGPHDPDDVCSMCIQVAAESGETTFNPDLYRRQPKSATSSPQKESAVASQKVTAPVSLALLDRKPSLKRSHEARQQQQQAEREQLPNLENKTGNVIMTTSTHLEKSNVPLLHSVVSSSSDEDPSEYQKVSVQSRPRASISSQGADSGLVAGSKPSPQHQQANKRAKKSKRSPSPADKPLDEEELHRLLPSSLEGFRELLEAVLAEQRERCQRPENLDLMSYEQVHKEKIDLQKGLLYFEKLYGHPQNLHSKQVMKPLYDRYRKVKRIVNSNNNNESSISSDHFLNNASAIASCSIPVSLSNVSMDKLASQQPNDDQSLFEYASLLLDLSVNQLKNEKIRVLNGKFKLQKLLRDFEARVQQLEGRRANKLEREQMRAEYNQYREQKQRLKMVDTLLGQGTVPFLRQHETKQAAITALLLASQLSTSSDTQTTTATTSESSKTTSTQASRPLLYQSLASQSTSASWQQRDTNKNSDTPSSLASNNRRQNTAAVGSNRPKSGPFDT